MSTACECHGIDTTQRRIRGHLDEWDLPMCVRDELDAARAARPEADVECLAFRTSEDGREIRRVGPDSELFGNRDSGSMPPRLQPRDLLVLSVTATETTFERVRSVTHVLVARTTRRSRGTPGPSLTR